ncbi:MAG: hypothetical protein JRF46_08400 [Deltaproteobacteria bacterium]|nr:hypothetical protein [Deltaproteobacteria bacterium]
MEQFQLTTQSIPKLVKQISSPASIGYFFQTMYNVVDTYFGGTISTQALASLSLSLPVFFIIIAMGTGISTGTTALIGNALGSSRGREARLFGLQGITFGLLVSIGLTFTGIYISPWLFSLLGASGEYLSMAKTYMDTIFYGTLPFLLLYMLNAILNALGETKPYRNFLIIGFLLNIATLTLVAQNNGAGLIDRVKGSVRTALRYGTFIMALGTVGVFSLAGPLMRVFSHEQNVIGIGVTYLRIDALVLYAYVILFVNVAAMQGIKNPMFAVWIGICRQVIAPVVLFWILTRVLDFGLLGIWWGIFSITWSAALFSVFYVRAKFQEAVGSFPLGIG